MAPTESGSSPADRRAAIFKEMVIFLVGFGVVLSIGAFFALKGAGKTAEAWGTRTGYLMGVPVAVFAAGFVVCGILVGIFRRPLFAYVAAVWAALLGLTHWVVMTLLHSPPINLIGILVLVMPFLILNRARAFSKATRDMLLPPDPTG